MSFERVSTILEMADKANTAVIGFNCIGYDMIYSLIQTADELGKPAIVTLYPEHHTVSNASSPWEFAGIVRDLASKARVPIGLHLDHCSDFQYILQVIQAGFSSVMYDGSMLPIEENIATAKRVVEVAHTFGVDVEAELGHIGLASDDAEKDTDTFTQPEMAKYFCEQTGVDSIAIAIGNAHGLYKGTPHLDFQRLEEINAATDTRLVLHGGTGIPHDQLLAAFSKGINKLNVGTEFFQTYYAAITEYCADQKRHPELFDMAHHTQARLRDYLRQKMQLCSLSL